MKEDGVYPPSLLNGRSPYFIGKPRKKHFGQAKKKPRHIEDSGSPVGGPDSPYVIDDDENESEVEFRRKCRPSSLIADGQQPSTSCRPHQSSDILFDFSGDSRLNSVKKKVLSALTPGDGKSYGGRFPPTPAMLLTKGDAMTVGGTKNMKRLKPMERRGVASLNDFRMANGDSVVKEVRSVIPAGHGSDESQSDTGTSSDTRGYLGNKRIGGFNAPVVIKKGLEAMTVDRRDADSENVTGLRAEPTLKHFDENIISLIESEIMVAQSETGWSDVAGLEGAKKALREIVVLPFKRPDVFKGIRAPPKGVLLFGPPGTGKTMIGRCVASQCQATFFNISASSLTSKWVGEGEKLVRALFAVARLKLPSVIFIDEIDSLLSARSESEHESSRRIKTEFLVQLDGVTTSVDERLLVLGATNRPQELDEAARRRFAKRLYIALPDAPSRLTIVRNLLVDMRHSLGEPELERIAQCTNGYSGADMRQLCAEAALGPIRDIDNCSQADIETVNEDDIRPISVEDFIDAAKVVRPTVVEEDLVSYLAWDKKFGCLL